MKNISLIISLLVGLSYATIAQEISEDMAQTVTDFTIQLDKSAKKDPRVLQGQIRQFMDEISGEEAKKAVLSLIYEKTTATEVKSMVEFVSGGSVGYASYIVLKNATIIDAVDNTGRKGDLLIKNERIDRISYTNDLSIPQGAVTYDLDGKYLIPGLIDAHVHVTHGTFREAQEHLLAALKQGVTGVREMGGDGRMLTLLKKNYQIGEDPGPDIFFSTILAGPSFFEADPRPQSVAMGAKAGQVSWQRAITNETDLKQIVAEAKGLGATAIKVYLSVDKELFAKVAAEAKRQGLKVWAHAVVHPAKALDITNGGADVMSHAGDLVQYEFVKGGTKGRYDFATKEAANAYRTKLNNTVWDKNSKEVKRLFAAMKQNNSILDATLFIYSLRLSPLSADQKVDSTYYKLAMKATKMAYDLGVKIGAGSDEMISEDGHTINIHRELELLVEAGLTPIDAIRAATIINAEGLGEANEIGTVQQGKLANLVVLNADPLESIGHTRDIKYVFKRGQLIEF